MAKPYSEDLRVRVVTAVEGGLSRRQAAALFNLGISTVVHWVPARAPAYVARATSLPRPSPPLIRRVARRKNECKKAVHSRTLVAAGQSVAMTAGKATFGIRHPVFATKMLPRRAFSWVAANRTVTD
jgi:hypothetical protein